LLLENRVAVITGSAKGMGKAMALRFAREGCDIVVADIDWNGAQKVAKEVESGGRKAIAIKTDINSSKEIKSLIEASIQEFGKIDILVNNAGAAGGGDLEHSDEDEWDKVLLLNLKGAFLACKAGILGLTLNLAFELAPFNIYVNCIVPGPIETPFWDPLSKGMSAEKKKAFFAALAKKEVPLGRMGTPEDIAGPALFFASDLSSYVTGHIMCVAGGQPGLSVESTFISSEETKDYK
jgi:NAD(P)-dependent dehydrogenase (short-subunit alcohol dehydrogenase family)